MDEQIPVTALIVGDHVDSSSFPLSADLSEMQGRTHYEAVREASLKGWQLAKLEPLAPVMVGEGGGTSMRRFLMHFEYTQTPALDVTLVMFEKGQAVKLDSVPPFSEDFRARMLGMTESELNHALQGWKETAKMNAEGRTIVFYTKKSKAA